MSKIPTVCLNMIVKNESKIITRLFDSVILLIDCYCICDTGSTDDTVDIIENYFKEKKVFGKIVKEEFKNFAYNRNFALRECVGMSDYVLVLDADMLLQLKEFNKNILNSGDFFPILQGNDAFQYSNTRIFKNIKGNGDTNFNFFKYIGVTHEYISTPNCRIVNLPKENIFIVDLGDGGCKNDKFERDIKLLTQGIIDEPQNCTRYFFYLANSYFNSNKFEEAIINYEKRIKDGGWEQEVWYSYYRIGQCYKNLNKIENAISTWLQAYDFFPNRIENLYEIVNYYRLNCKNKLALSFYKMAKEVLNKDINRYSYLFLHNDIYTYKLDYEFLIVAFFNGESKVSEQLKNVFNNCNDQSIISNTLSNMKFYKNILKPTCSIDISVEISYKIKDKDIKFNSSSSCIIPDSNGGYIMNIRFVNYKIDKDGGYLNCKSGIVSLNKYIKLTKEFKVLESKLFSLDNFDMNRLYIGLEDLRIFKEKDNSLSFIGTGYHENDTLGIATGKYDISKDILVYNDIKTSFSDNKCEKNWVFFDYKNEKHVLYNWYPLQICKIIDNKLERVENKIMPNIFKYIRGSTCGFTYINGVTPEIWFITHIVSYENPRYYYNIFCIFNDKMDLLRYSSPFKFDIEPIEYCLGLIVENERIICTYSTWDRTTKLAIFNKKYIEDMLV